MSTKSTNRSEPPAKATADLEILANFMDNRYKTPIGRFGWDGLLGLVPGVGDLVTSGLAFYIVVRAAMLGCPPSILMRMSANLLLENVADLVPIFGNIFDFYWKANAKNVKLLSVYTSRPQEATWKSRFLVGAVVMSLFLILITFLAGAIWLVYQMVVLLTEKV